MASLSQNFTWSLSTHPRGKTTVGCHWVFALLGVYCEALA